MIQFTKFVILVSFIACSACQNEEPAETTQLSNEMVKVRNEAPDYEKIQAELQKYEEFAATSKPSKVEIILDDKGFNPSQFVIRAGTPAQLLFKRVASNDCGGTLEISHLHVNREMPLNKIVEVAFVPNTSNTFKFNCGKREGTVVVQ